MCISIMVLFYFRESPLSVIHIDPLYHKKGVKLKLIVDSKLCVMNLPIS